MNDLLAGAAARAEEDQLRALEMEQLRKAAAEHELQATAAQDALTASQTAVALESARVAGILERVETALTVPGTQGNIARLTNKFKALVVVLQSVEVSVLTKASSVELGAVDSRLSALMGDRAQAADVWAVESASKAELCDLATTILTLLLSSLVNFEVDLREAIMNGTRDLQQIMAELLQGKEGSLWTGHMVYDDLSTRDQVATMLAANRLSEVCTALSGLVANLTQCQNRTIDPTEFGAELILECRTRLTPEELAVACSFLATLPSIPGSTGGGSRSSRLRIGTPWTG